MFIYYFTLVKFSDVLRIDGCIGMEIPIGEFRCLLAASWLSGRHFAGCSSCAGSFFSHLRGASLTVKMQLELLCQFIMNLVCLTSPFSLKLGKTYHS